MGPAQLAGVLSIVARQAAEAAGTPYDEEARRARCGRGRGADRGGVAAAVPVRPALRRRRHRPARHPHRAGHVPVGHRQPRRSSGSRRLRRLPDVSDGPAVITRAAGRQPRRDRPPGLPHLPRPRHRHGRRLLRRGRRRAARRARPTAPSGCRAARRRTPTCAATCSSTAARRRRRRRRPPRLRLPVGERRLRAGRRRRRADLGRPAAGGDRGDGLQGRGQEADGRRRACRCCRRARPRRRSTEADLPGAGQGVRRRRRPRHAHRARRSASCAERGRGGPARGGVGVRRRDGLLRAATSSAARHVEVQVLADAHGNVVVAGRAGVLDPAPAPEGRRGDAVAGGRRRSCADRLCRGGDRGGRARSATSAPAPSSSSLDADGRASGSWR